MKSKIYVEEIEVRGFTFSGGERQIKLPENLPRKVTIGAVIWNAEGIMDLLLVGNALKLQGISIEKMTIPYLPYARQDRACEKGEAHALQVMAQLINSLDAEEVYIIDAHSSVAEALINNYRGIDLNHIFGSYWPSNLAEDYDVLIAPDAGAEKKVFKLAQEYGLPVEVARKVRCTKTGDILKTVFNSETDLNDKRVLIVDDICDGGRTFIELAKVLAGTYVMKQCDLYVSHGIFSKGIEPLKEHFDNVYSTNIDEDLCLDIKEN